MLALSMKESGVATLRMAFADPIKDIADHLLGISKEISYGTQQDKLDYMVYGKSARHWLQWIGTEMAREQIHADIWVHRFVEKALASDAPVVIGSDCRFRNEMTLVRTMLTGKMELMIIKIVNPRVPVNLSHQSESEVYNIPADEFDLNIQNTFGLSELEDHITALTNKILPRIS